jgi:hypothetical protein
MASDTERKCAIQFPHSDKTAPVDIQRLVLNINGDQTVELSTSDISDHDIFITFGFFYLFSARTMRGWRFEGF